jgi:Fic family protein
MSGYWNVISKLPGVKKTVKKTFEYVVPKISKNLTTKRAIQDKVVKAVDEGTKKGLQGRTASESIKQSASKWKKDKSKELKDISYKWDKLVAKKDKNIKETKTLLKATGATAAAGAGTAGVSLYNKKKKK